jgi:integrase
MIKTEEKGVYFRYKTNKVTGKKEKVFYIQYYDRQRKRHMEKVDKPGHGVMNARKAKNIRELKISGNLDTNNERRRKEKEKNMTIKAEKDAEKNKWTITRLWSEYQSSKPFVKRLRVDKGLFNNHISPAFGNKEPHEILPLEVDRLRLKLSKIRKPATVWGALELLRRLSNFGKKRKLCGGLDFTIEFPKVNNKKTEDLTPDQLQNLLDSIDADENNQAKNLMKLVLFTGLRRGELFRLKWDDVFFDRGFIYIRDPKGEEDQKIPLNDAVKDLLLGHERPYPESPFVFPGRNGNQRVDIKYAVNRIKKRAGLPKDFRPLHGLRHTFASMLASSGQVDMYTLQKLLTHKSPQMTQRYAHLRDDALKQASEVAGEIINNINGKAAKNKVVNMPEIGK